MCKGYVIQSISDEGIYYLCNGWNKHKTFWVTYGDIDKAIFKAEHHAKTSLTKLLKIMPEYKSDDYKYGTSWIKFDIPDDDLKLIKELVKYED